MVTGRSKTLSIVGTQGVPASYGGFETLAENIVVQNQTRTPPFAITVYCSKASGGARPSSYHGAKLKHLPIRANGVASIPYDIVSMFLSIWHRTDVLLVLGVSGAVFLPVVRLFSKARIVTNVDGLEWRRAKWGGMARAFLKFSERMALRFSHEVVADNPAIAEHLLHAYGRVCPVIPYGGDHAIAKPVSDWDGVVLPQRYALAISRIEPENNPALILEAFAKNSDLPLVYLGNWEATAHGRALKRQFENTEHLHLLPAEYDIGKLRFLRENAIVYVHGHSAGGTNPSLVEMMHFGRPIVAFDCAFNRHTTKEKALYFNNSNDLQEVLGRFDETLSHQIGSDMCAIAKDEYCWAPVAQKYFELFEPPDG